MRVRGLKLGNLRRTNLKRLSHPMRVRGLKQYPVWNMISEYKVAPHAGAWIETTNGMLYVCRTLVAPHAGAWIETKRCLITRRRATVAPHAGAWIETTNTRNYGILRWSHPMRVRGLKLAFSK